VPRLTLRRMALDGLAVAILQRAEQPARQGVLNELNSFSEAYRVVLNDQELSDGSELVAARQSVGEGGALKA
jgi:hypothetical protein